jgi:hypothetical protein
MYIYIVIVIILVNTRFYAKILLKGDKVIKNQTKSCLNIAFVTFLQLLL